MVYVTEIKNAGPIKGGGILSRLVNLKNFDNTNIRLFSIPECWLMILVSCYKIFNSERAETARLNVKIMDRFRRFLTRSLDQWSNTL